MSILEIYLCGVLVTFPLMLILFAVHRTARKQLKDGYGYLFFSLASLLVAIVWPVALLLELSVQLLRLLSGGGEIRWK
jgi:uncharacterized membrane protein